MQEIGHTMQDPRDRARDLWPPNLHDNARLDPIGEKYVVRRDPAAETFFLRFAKKGGY